MTDDEKNAQIIATIPPETLAEIRRWLAQYASTNDICLHVRATISDVVAVSQTDYAARPYCVGWATSHFWGAFRFHTLDDAHAYIQQQWANIRRSCERERYRASNLRDSYLETPTGKISLRYVLLCDDVSSY